MEVFYTSIREEKLLNTGCAHVFMAYSGNICKFNTHHAALKMSPFSSKPLYFTCNRHCVQYIESIKKKAGT